MIPDIGNVNVNSNIIPTVGVGVVGNIGNVNVTNANVSNVNVNKIPTSNSIRVADARVWTVRPPNTFNLDAPVVVNIGKPIVNMPGCVAVHKENAKQRNKNKQLVNDDPKGNTVLCDGGMPYFNPPDYQYNRLTWQTFYGDQPEAGGVDTGDPPDPITPETPAPPVTPPTTSEDVPCPPPNARRIGDLNQAGNERVKEYELQPDPVNRENQICVTLWEPIPFVDKYLPSAQIVTTTAGIAAVATTSALLAKPLADLLLKVVKPAVKKVIGKVKSLLGKKEPVLSLRERMLAQRERNRAVMELRKALKK